MLSKIVRNDTQFVHCPCEHLDVSFFLEHFRCDTIVFNLFTFLTVTLDAPMNGRQVPKPSGFSISAFLPQDNFRFIHFRVGLSVFRLLARPKTAELSKTHGSDLGIGGIYFAMFATSYNFLACSGAPLIGANHLQP